MVSIVGHRAAVESTIDLMEDLRSLVIVGLNTLGARFKGMGGPVTTDLAGIPVLAATMEIDLITERQT